MEIKSRFTRSVLFPLLMRRWHPQARSYLAELRKYEFADHKTLITAQWQRLQAIVQHAAQNVPYYRNVFAEHGIWPADIQSPADFSRVPVLTKGILQSNLHRLIAENRNKSQGQANASGGSTGKPVQFFQDAEYWNRSYASLWFVEGWWGIRPGDRTASLWGADRDIPDQNWKERLHGAIAQVRVCNAFALTSLQMEAFAKMLVKWRPKHLIGYASALEVFAKFLLERPEYQIRPAAVKATAETLRTDSRKMLAAVFGCPVYNFYGSREVNNLAVECPALRGLHINGLNRYIEIVDDEGRPVRAHVPGRILVTDLTNSFMPLLRYEIEDVGSWAGESCSCGRPFPLLERVWGRSSDFIVTRTGKLIHGEYFTHLFYHVPQVSSFQVVQQSLDDVHVSVVLHPGINEFSFDTLRDKMSKSLGQGVRCEINVVESIPRSSSGKHRFTISQVRPSWNEARSLSAKSTPVAVG